MEHPRLETRPAEGETRGIAVFCHGGTAASVSPPKDKALSLVRMRAFEQFVHRSAAERGIATCLVRYRVAGWNGEAADAFADVRWAIGQMRAEHGADVPIVLVGHSMGGRAALRAGGEPSVTGVCALAPWTPPGEPVMHLRDQTVTILHGRADRWVPAKLSADFAVRARRAGARVARFTVAGGHGMLRSAHQWHTFARDAVLAGTGLEPMRADVSNALRQPSPEGLAVPL
ncbi:alpha/beta hydrolase [Modestobacter sp. I12A-02628]|uniref:Alpha/beta hydrolase n=1 Tax=Goekera deserti TaxID=2497753 RepID=A0A7K3WF73_9ACTN|nr:alpha/beta fold hydrolase [Goekera deserti]MPR00011.1 alpha/beta hydrolase [Goekera deserti]NDI49789.1 alpha/beta hydrolase [Goekera deserti]NEL55151.1 alpha/beta hydrolase [Goekera deserti]